MQLLVFSSPSGLQREPQLIESLFDHGLQTLHLRKPGLDAEGYEAILRALPAAGRAKIVLHEHHHLAARWDTKGVHYTEKRRMQVGRIQRLPGLTSSTALHQLEQLNEDLGDLDYACLSPIFDSISKTGYQAAFSNRELLKAAVAACPVPLFALGGIDESNICQAAELGFAGVAALGSVWGAADPAGETRKLLEACAAAP